MSKQTDILTYLTSDEQKLWKKSTELAKTRVWEPDINDFYKKDIVKLFEGFERQNFCDDGEDVVPDQVYLDREQVDAIVNHQAKGYNIRVYVDDARIKAEATKSYLDNVAYGKAVDEYKRLTPAKEQARKDIDMLNDLIKTRKNTTVVSDTTDPATIAILAMKNLKMK
jgi:hypothetical protein